VVSLHINQLPLSVMRRGGQSEDRRFGLVLDFGSMVMRCVNRFSFLFFFLTQKMQYFFILDVMWAFYTEKWVLNNN